MLALCSIGGQYTRSHWFGKDATVRGPSWHKQSTAVPEKVKVDGRCYGAQFPTNDVVGRSSPGDNGVRINWNSLDKKPPGGLLPPDRSVEFIPHIAPCASWPQRLVVGCATSHKSTMKRDLIGQDVVI
eukprot:148848-Amphidinium_carterae.1